MNRLWDFLLIPKETSNPWALYSTPSSSANNSKVSHDEALKIGQAKLKTLKN